MAHVSKDSRATCAVDAQSLTLCVGCEIQQVVYLALARYVAPELREPVRVVAELFLWEREGAAVIWVRQLRFLKVQQTKKKMFWDTA